VRDAVLGILSAPLRPSCVIEAGATHSQSLSTAPT
jgi:hypothetical protein